MPTRGLELCSHFCEPPAPCPVITREQRHSLTLVWAPACHGSPQSHNRAELSTIREPLHAASQSCLQGSPTAPPRISPSDWLYWPLTVLQPYLIFKTKTFFKSSTIYTETGGHLHPYWAICHVRATILPPWASSSHHPLIFVPALASPTTPT